MVGGFDFDFLGWGGGVDLQKVENLGGGVQHKNAVFGLLNWLGQLNTRFLALFKLKYTIYPHKSIKICKNGHFLTNFQ